MPPAHQEGIGKPGGIGEAPMRTSVTAAAESYRRAKSLSRGTRNESYSVGEITYRHSAHRAPLAFKAITALPQPTAFAALAQGFDGECPCCRRPFADAA
jgi:hypothetical protein